MKTTVYLERDQLLTLGAFLCVATRYIYLTLTLSPPLSISVSLYYYVLSIISFKPQIIRLGVSLYSDTFFTFVTHLFSPCPLDMVYGLYIQKGCHCRMMKDVLTNVKRDISNQSISNHDATSSRDQVEIGKCLVRPQVTSLSPFGLPC